MTNKQLEEFKTACREEAPYLTSEQCECLATDWEEVILPQFKAKKGKTKKEGDKCKN